MRPSPFVMRPLGSIAPQVFRVLLLGMLGAGCGSSSASSSKSPVVDVSAERTSAQSGAVAPQNRPRDEGDGPFDLIKRIVRGSDVDGDGSGDSDDLCPEDPEDFDGFEDVDGCPEPDNDRDGILDVNDKCPNAPENLNGVEDEDGCPEASDSRAKLAFREGATKLAQGDYAGARIAFESAYRTAPHDAILYNLAVCADKQGDRKAACDYYRRWRNSPHGANATVSAPSLDTCPP